MRKVFYLLISLAFALFADSSNPEQLQKQSLLERLEKEPVRQIKVAYKNGGAFFDIGGRLYRPVLYNSNFGWKDTPNFRAKIDNFAAADMNLISFGIEADRFWKGTGKFDYEELDKALSDMFTMAPNAYFMFDIGFSHGPKWWNEEHPDELVGYGRFDTEFSSRDCIGSFAAPSYASELWLKEASEVVRRAIEYIESKPYGKRVFAYRVDAGVYMEWHYYGMANSMPDVGPQMTRYFRKFLREKYNGDVQKLRDAWKQPEVTFETATPPPVDVRLKYIDNSLRDPVEHAWSLDFIRCVQSSLRNALLTMNKTAKEACKGRALVGNYCGYFFGMGYTAEGWHLVNDDFLRSEYVDFQVSPCCYGNIFRGLGHSMMARSLAASYRLHNKITIFEADGRTSIAPEDGNKHCDTIQDSVGMLSRDLVQAISKGCAYWNYDFGRDWYMHPDILKFFHNVAPVYDAVKDFSSAAEIAVIADWESVYYYANQNAYGGPASYMGVNYLTPELKRSGIQFDAYSFGDIDNPALEKYKVYIFPQLFYMTPEKIAKLNALKKAGKTFLFIGTPGWLTPNGQDDGSIAKTTGIQATVLHENALVKTTLTDGTDMDYYEFPDEIGWKYAPLLKVTDSDATVLGTIDADNGEKVPTYARKKNADGSITYVNGAPVMTATELRRIFNEAGVHIYCDSDNGVVYANNSMISFHTATPGEYTLKAKAPVKWTMVYPEKRTYPEAKAELTFEAPQTNTYIFMIEP